MTEKLLYDATFPLLYRFLYYKYVDKPDIEDIIQETYLRFFHKYRFEKLSMEDCTKILYRISRNVYLEWIKKNSQRIAYQLNEQLDIADSYGDFLTPPEEDVTVDPQYQERLNEALDTLQPKMRSVLVLRFIEGCSRQETADKLNMPESQVHTYQKRGIKILQKRLGSVPPRP